MEMQSHLGHPYLESINIRYLTDQNASNFLVKFLVNFQRKRVEISTMCECNLKIVKIYQKSALTLRVAHSPKSCSESKKQLKIVQVAKKLPSRISLGLDLNLAETLFFFRLSFTLSVSNIQFHTPTPCPTPPPGTRTSRETQTLVSLDARRFISKAIQLISPKRVNLLISLPDFLLLHNEIGRILCWGMLEESRWTCLKSL